MRRRDRSSRGRPGAARRHKRRRHLVTLAEGGEFHTHAGVAARRAHRAPTRASRPHHPRRPLTRRAADAGGVRARDAARRPGHLSEGPRADPDARRHLPRRPHPRVGRRLGRAHDDAAARSGRPATSPATRCATTSPTGPRNVEGFLGDDVPLDVEVRDVYDGIDETDLDRVVLDLPEPWRVVKHAEGAAPGGILVAYTRRSCRSRGCARRSTAPFGMARRSRCCNAPGTSTASPSGPTTGWSPTPASSPTPGCSCPPSR